MIPWWSRSNRAESARDRSIDAPTPAGVRRTASKRRPTAKELAEVYTPTTEDLAFVRGIARGGSRRRSLAYRIYSASS